MKKVMALLLVLGMFIGACAQQQMEEKNTPAQEVQEQPAGKNTQEDTVTKEDTVTQEDTVTTGDNVNQPKTDETPQTEIKEFKIESKQFTFLPETIEVNKGDKVRLIVTSADVPHGIAIPEYGINARLPVGEPVTIEFVADKEGTFTAFCSVFCGSGHSKMKNRIIVK